MPLSPAQRAKARELAAEHGLDEQELIAAAEAEMGSGEPEKPGEAPQAEKPKLFMYLLPFVTVREVRQNWLGLSDSFPGDSSVASEWAAKHGAGQAPSTPDVPE